MHTYLGLGDLCIPLWILLQFYNAEPLSFSFVAFYPQVKVLQEAAECWCVDTIRRGICEGARSALLLVYVFGPLVSSGFRSSPP